MYGVSVPSTDPHGFPCESKCAIRNSQPDGGGDGGGARSAVSGLPPSHSRTDGIPQRPHSPSSSGAAWASQHVASSSQPPPSYQQIFWNNGVLGRPFTGDVGLLDNHLDQMGPIPMLTASPPMSITRLVETTALPNPEQRRYTYVQLATLVLPLTGRQQQRTPSRGPQSWTTPPPLWSPSTNG